MAHPPGQVCNCLGWPLSGEVFCHAAWADFVGVGLVPLCSLADVRGEMDLAESDTRRDNVIVRYIDAASSAIQDVTEREFEDRGQLSRRLVVDSLAGIVALAPYDLRVVTGVTMRPGTNGSVVVPLASIMGVPVAARLGVFSRLMFARGVDYGSPPEGANFGVVVCEVSGLWGFPAVPGPVREAAVKTVASWLRRDASSFALDDGSPRGFLPVASVAQGIPGEAHALLSRYRRAVVGG